MTAPIAGWPPTSGGSPTYMTPHTASIVILHVMVRLAQNIGAFGTSCDIGRFRCIDPRLYGATRGNAPHRLRRPRPSVSGSKGGAAHDRRK
jgi:hypothetical protein